MRNDLNTGTLGARTTGMVVKVDSSTESCIARTRQGLKCDMLDVQLELNLLDQDRHTYCLDQDTV
jgi:hypothetical protein